MLQRALLTFLEVNAVLLHVLGALSAIHALLKVRTPQGAIAWCLALISFPYVAVPLYWIFGRQRFVGYRKARWRGDDELDQVARCARESLVPHEVPRCETTGPKEIFAFDDRLIEMPATCGNQVKLLIDGCATFDAIFEALQSATDYVLVQFFIVNDDEIGRELQRRLIERAKAGVRIYFIYDEVGSRALPRRYVRELRDAGVMISPFRTSRGLVNRFQLNFRNHRKLIIADGRIALTGGLNAGDEYLGRSKRFGPWRDTFVSVQGPSVQALQLPFLEDWFWASGEILSLNWTPQPCGEPGGGWQVAALPTGPADDLEVCSLLFLRAMNVARRRLWITSPYLVPDPAVVSCLQLAAFRGVDVRIMLPSTADHLLPFLSSFSYYPAMGRAGVKIYRYQGGFMHQKVMLVDDDVASVGSVNLDFRSFHLNFELAVMVAGREFAAEVERMLLADFQQCREEDLRRFEEGSPVFRTKVALARLLSPVQ